MGGHRSTVLFIQLCLLPRGVSVYRLGASNSSNLMLPNSDLYSFCTVLMCTIIPSCSCFLYMPRGFLYGSVERITSVAILFSLVFAMVDCLTVILQSLIGS